MGRLYNKSKSESYQDYFAKQESIERKLQQYSINDKKFVGIAAGKGTFQEGGKGGVPISWNREKQYVYVDHTDSHTLILGATGSQKTRIGIMPTVMILGQAGESMIITDPKAEICNRTAYYLEELGYDIQILNLRETTTGDGWNPLSIPYIFYLEGNVDRAYEFVSDIAHNLMNSDVGNSKDPFWDNSAESLFFGLTILMFKYCKDFHFAQEYVNVNNIIRLREKMFTGNTISIITNKIWQYGKKDDFIYSALVGTVETATDTRAGILSVFDEKMTCFRIQPGLLQALCENSIDFENLGKQKKAIYIIMPDEKTIFHKLVSLFVKQSYEYLIYQVHNESTDDNNRLAYRVNYIIDEFSALPAIKDFPAMITAARSRNIRFFLVAQSKKQIVQKYGEEAESIQSNCNNWLFFTSRELDLLKELSELCGLNNKQKHILEVAELQHLSKEDHEVLILSGRNLPYIAMLPDIDQYQAEWENYVIRRREVEPICILDYEEIMEPSLLKNNLNSKEYDMKHRERKE